MFEDAVAFLRGVEEEEILDYFIHDFNFYFINMGRSIKKGHGGGEGKAPIGRAGPVTPWGKPALGLKTRKKNKPSNKLVVRRRRRVSKRSRGGRDS